LSAPSTAETRGYELEERPLNGQWVWGWRRGDDARHPCFLTEREALSYMLRGNSVVLVTACEYRPSQGSEFADLDHDRVVGPANVWVSNIAPHDGDPSGVTFVVNVDSDYPIPISTDITVLDAFPVDVENE
jgi:hypothetical protein